MRVKYDEIKNELRATNHRGICVSKPRSSRQALPNIATQRVEC